MQLQDQRLFRQQCYLNGQWLDANSQATFVVNNPADNNPLGTVPNLGIVETRLAITSANTAWQTWRQLLAKERAQLLLRWHQLILEHVEDLAVLLTLEQGKPLAEARNEILYGAAYIEWFAEEAKRAYGDIIPTNHSQHRLLVLKQPVGVVAAITPWNFPNAMITRKCAPALAAGCTIVIKAASATPFSALALAELADRAGFPAGVFNVITGDAKIIGQELASNPLVRKLSFTGSTAIGKILMKQCADTVKKVSLELGGNAPFIVFSSANLDAAVAGLMASKFRNTGQTCVCANRILVQADIYDAFTEKLVIAVQQLTVGNGLDPNTQQGPLINHDAIHKIQSLLSQALQQGAQIRCGGKLHDLGGNYFQPTVLTEAAHSMQIVQEEIFGPVAPLIRFKDEAEAIQLANDTEYGLAAYFYSRDPDQIWRVAEQLEYGVIGSNTGITSAETAPFGGMKASGIGREGSRYGLNEYLEMKYVCMANSA